jgi:hypothetical protein
MKMTRDRVIFFAAIASILARRRFLPLWMQSRRVMAASSIFPILMGYKNAADVRTMSRVLIRPQRHCLT